MLIACDPGTKYCAFAIYNDNKFQTYAKVSSSFQSIQEFLKEFRDFEFVIEDQYLNLNVKTLIKLVSIRTMVLTLAKVAGAEKCVIIPPQKWQRLILGVNIKSKREQRKKVSCMVASSIANSPIQDNDVADAICIGEYAIRAKPFSVEPQ